MIYFKQIARCYAEGRKPFLHETHYLSFLARYLEEMDKLNVLQNYL